MRLELIDIVNDVMNKRLLTYERNKDYSGIVSKYISTNKCIYYFRFYNKYFELTTDEKLLVTFRYNIFTNIDDMLYEIDCVPEIKNYLRNKKLNEILNEI